MVRMMSESPVNRVKNFVSEPSKMEQMVQNGLAWREWPPSIVNHSKQPKYIDIEGAETDGRPWDTCWTSVI
jgi:hypothetical protein